MLPVQVPPVGGGYETPFLDLKAHPDAYRPTVSGNRVWDYFELAKDVASFANRSGGTILVGATQDRATGTCSGHTPFAPALANDFEVVLRDAIEKRCRPRPLIQFDTLPFGADVMVAINIWAFPGQAISVEVKAHKPDGYGGQAYVFPIRVLSHTTYLAAEQVPMLMSPDARRCAVLLSTLKAGAKIKVHPKMILDSDQHLSPFEVDFVEVDEMKNSLMVNGQVKGRPEVVGIPLDDVSVWYQGDRCHVRCDRRLVIQP